LQAQKQFPAAVEAYKKALAIDSHFGAAWSNLGAVLYAQKDLPAAVDACKKAVSIDPQNVGAWLNLGAALASQKDLPGAVDAFNKALAIDPQDAQAWYNLGIAVMDQGEFAQALKALQKAHELGLDSAYAVASRIKSCERLLALEQKLPAALQGEAASPAEELALADLCLRYKQRYRDAVVLYSKAFAAESKLADDPRTGHRYKAACAAVLAAAGKGAGADKLDNSDNTRLRQQALHWLQAELALWRGQLESDAAKARPVLQQLQHWQQNPDFVGVRGAAALTKLPDGERQAWQRFWQEVETLRRRATEPK
jgi:Tfp pilus assembly protein PilF